MNQFQKDSAEFLDEMAQEAEEQRERDKREVEEKAYRYAEALKGFIERCEP